MLKHIFITSMLISGTVFGMDGQDQALETSRSLFVTRKKQSRPHRHLGAAERLFIQMDSVNAFNFTYTPEQTNKAVETMSARDNETDQIIGKLLATSPLTQRFEQVYVINDLVGGDREAHTIFKDMPSGKAVPQALARRTLSKKTGNRLNRSDAFLLSKQNYGLCATILNDAKKTGHNGERVLKIDAKKYNAIAHLPPHVREAVGRNIIAEVNTTFTEKLVNIGICTVGWSIAGGIAGGTIGLIAETPINLGKAVIQNGIPIIITTAKAGLDSAVTFDPETFQNTLCDAPEYDYHVHQKIKKTVQVKSLKEIGSSTLNAGQIALGETLSSVPLINNENGKKGAYYGAIIGGTLGLGKSLRYIGEPKKRVYISSLKKEQ